MKIVATSPSFSKSQTLQDEIYRYFPNAKLNVEGKRFKKDELIDFIKDADAVVVGLEPIDEEVLKACKNLKLVSKYGVGLNNIDLEACEKYNVEIGWTGGVNRLSVAEMALGFMLMFSRNLYVTSNQLKNGVWNKSGGMQLSGKTIGIIGVGNVGKELIRLLEPFKCKILVNDIIDQSKYYEENNLVEATREEIYIMSDTVTIHTPLDQDTSNLIDYEVMQQMKNTAYLLNTSRGGIVNEQDLKKALLNQEIAGAAIDVFVVEPPEDEELLSLPNLICTPHIGGNAQEAVEAMGMSAIKHLREYFNV